MMRLLLFSLLTKMRPVSLPWDGAGMKAATPSARTRNTFCMLTDPSRTLGGQDRNRHGAELHPLRLLQQPELIEIKRGRARLRAGTRSLLISIGFLWVFIFPQIFGQPLLRLAAHDLLARLDGAIGEWARISEPV